MASAITRPCSPTAQQEPGRATVTNCAFNGNSAAEAGGAVHNEWGSSSAVSNCIFWGNTASDGNEIALVYESTIDVNYCDVAGGQTDIYSDDTSTVNWGPGNIDSDPCFVEPGYWADANDPNITVEPNDPNAVWIEGDYHLLVSSPCINAGDPNYIAEPNETDLDGLPRVIAGRIDMGAYEANYIEVAMKFTPQALNPGSQGKWMKAHFVLPEEFAVEDVDADRPAVVEPGGIESDYMNVFINDDGLVEIEAAFGRAEFCSIVTGGEPMEVTVVGWLTSGQQFYGTDTIKITTNIFEYLAVLASHWLEMDCDKPDWCEGADLDQDSLVNFVDFALFDGCCIEVVKD